jgi:ribosomal silencing factor RsfS
MCGIALFLDDFVLSAGNSAVKNSDLWNNLCSVCADRGANYLKIGKQLENTRLKSKLFALGPDWSDSVLIDLFDDEKRKRYNLSIYASVLHLRGENGPRALTRHVIRSLAATSSLK